MCGLHSCSDFSCAVYANICSDLSVSVLPGHKKSPVFPQSFSNTQPKYEQASAMHANYFSDSTWICEKVYKIHQRQPNSSLAKQTCNQYHECQCSTHWWSWWTISSQTAFEPACHFLVSCHRASLPTHLVFVIWVWRLCNNVEVGEVHMQTEEKETWMFRSTKSNGNTISWSSPANAKLTLIFLLPDSSATLFI